VLTHTPIINQARRNALLLNGASGSESPTDYEYVFDPMFARVAKLISSADLAICHLETPIAPAGEALSTFPFFGVPPQITDAIANSGFDRCSTASNHTYDRGARGIDATISALTASGLGQSGMAHVPSDIEPKIFLVNSVKLTHLSYTFSYNGLSLPDDQQWRSAVIDPERILLDAKKARELGAQVVIVSMHWGNEKDSRASSMQTKIAEQLTASGLIDLIVGHHAHVVQPIAQLNGVWVFYGLGNVLSNLPTDDRWPANSQDAVIATINMTITSSGKVVVDRPVVHPTWVDKDHGWVIRPVLEDLADPNVAPGTKAVLKTSLARTAKVLGDYFPK
jgi:poly-gamma-glutamate synthesis protein (capsule biosynthesis protein)